VVTQSSYDARCDLWSTGAVWYEMLVGQAPFHDSACESIDALVHEIQSLHPLFISLPMPTSKGVSETACLLVSGLLTRAPDKRVSFETFFEHSYLDLEHIPSTTSLKTGLSHIETAVSLDEALMTNNSSDTVQNVVDEYTQGVAHLLSHLEYCGKVAVHTGYVSNRVPLLQHPCSTPQDISKYIDRAEMLQRTLQQQQTANRHTPKPPKKSRKRDKNLDFYHALFGKPLSSELRNKAADYLERALYYQKQNDYKTALEKCDAGIEYLLLALSQEKNIEMQNRIRMEACDWLDRAETIKQQLKRTQ
jgi:serine/threonine protein kinase